MASSRSASKVAEVRQVPRPQKHGGYSTVPRQSFHVPATADLLLDFTCFWPGLGCAEVASAGLGYVGLVWAALVWAWLCWAELRSAKFRGARLQVRWAYGAWAVLGWAVLGYPGVCSVCLSVCCVLIVVCPVKTEVCGK